MKIRNSATNMMPRNQSTGLFNFYSDFFNQCCLRVFDMADHKMITPQPRHYVGLDKKTQAKKK